MQKDNSVRGLDLPPKTQFNYGFISSIVIWLGIIGTSVTLFSNLRKIVEFSGLVGVLADYWNEFFYYVWSWLLKSFVIDLSPTWVPLLTFSCFILITLFGLKLSRIFILGVKNQSTALNVGRLLKVLALIIGMYIFSYILLFVASIIIPGDDRQLQHYSILILFFLSALLIILGPYIASLIYSKEKIPTLVFSIMFVFIQIIMSLFPLFNIQWSNYNIEALDRLDALISAVFMMFIVSFVLFPLALYLIPIKDLIRRFAFIVVGLIFMLTLNEISKHGDIVLHYKHYLDSLLNKGS